MGAISKSLDIGSFLHDKLVVHTGLHLKTTEYYIREN